MKTAYDIILRPVITEQSMEAVDEKRYVFYVLPTATKPEIKAAIEEIFGVKVEKVNTLRMDGKAKRQGAYPQGRTAAYKKAMVKLTADSKTIEFFEGMA
ncbi:MAG: 50S ribosomal protein L23 [Oscillospiraceae bacterium]|nr:50S ribosomal protein L23 [Oscillospiraceae bacterium]